MSDIGKLLRNNTKPLWREPQDIVQLKFERFLISQRYTWYGAVWLKAWHFSCQSQLFQDLKIRIIAVIAYSIDHRTFV